MQTKSKAALFLDRDGVINKRFEDDYVKCVADFDFTDGLKEALCVLSQYFEYIFVVTNQQGVGKGLMEEAVLEEIHAFMSEEIKLAGGRIDKVYFCPNLTKDNSVYRKPMVGMGLKAAKDFPEISLKKSYMLGDTRSDMEFGKRLGMTTVLIGSNKKALQKPLVVDYRFDSVLEFSKSEIYVIR